MKKKDKKINKSLDSIYKFMADNYQGNWSYRWEGGSVDAKKHYREQE